MPDSSGKNALIIKKTEDFLKKNADRCNLEMAFLFGSRTTPFSRRDSDIDIGVVFSSSIETDSASTLSDDAVFANIMDISLDLLKLLNLEVNIVPVYPDFRKPMLYYNIIVLGKPLFIKNFEKYIALRNEAVYQMEDFSIFGERWKRDIAQKRLDELLNA
jgi:predicted nucleotidyltransferase